MIAIDTNILVYAHRGDSQFFASASKILVTLASKSERWAIPWPCLHEFYSVVTGSKRFDEPTPVAMALDQINMLVQSPSLVLLTETDWHGSALRDLITSTTLRGVKIHDARIAAICLQHRVRELWTTDRDFSRFPELKTVNPLV